MKGDFSRDSFDALKHYSRVLQQQGRVELDADHNERQSIQLHLLRNLAADLIGPQGGPGDGFKIEPIGNDKGTFLIKNGHYYVDGWLCENNRDVRYTSDIEAERQPWLPHAEQLPQDQNKRYLVYLDVWERHISAAQDNRAVERTSPTAMREVALGGQDTATRAHVVWQVKMSVGPSGPGSSLPDGINPDSWKAWMADNWETWRELWQSSSRGRLKARATLPTDADSTKPCIVSPQARYRGVENQLYRVEVHRGGASNSNLPPTFVWSRENGSVLFPVEQFNSGSVKLAEGWRDERFGLAAGDIVELMDRDTELSGAAGPLLRVTSVDLDSSTVHFEGGAGITANLQEAVLRRWDCGRRWNGVANRGPGNGSSPAIADDFALTIKEDCWLTLEDGVEVFFESLGDGGSHKYRTGDYWLIPARTATGDVLWPRASDTPHHPLAQPPDGVEHHYAPLAVVSVGVNTLDVSPYPARRFKSLVELS